MGGISSTKGQKWRKLVYLVYGGSVLVISQCLSGVVFGYLELALILKYLLSRTKMHELLL